MQYICTVKARDGKATKNYSIEAQNDTDLRRQLSANGLFLLEYKKKEQDVPKSASKGAGTNTNTNASQTASISDLASLGSANIIIGGSRLSSKDLYVMCRQLHSMLVAGVTLVRALDLMYLQIDKKSIKAATKELYEAVQKGEQFSICLRRQEKRYPEIMISMIEAGEGSGKLESALEHLSVHFESEMRMKSKVKGALGYPIALMAFTFGAVSILVTKVFPMFASMYADIGGELPLPTRMVISISDFLIAYWAHLLGVTVVVVAATMAYVRTEQGRYLWHSIILQLPLIGPTSRKIAAVRFSRALAMLTESGASLLYSLEITSRVVGNRVISASLVKSMEEINRGVLLSKTLRKANVFPSLIYSMVAIGEESGTLEQMLLRCSKYYDDEVDNSITALMKMLEPILIVIMSVVIGTVVVAMITPMYGIMGSIQ